MAKYSKFTQAIFGASRVWFTESQRSHHSYRLLHCRLLPWLIALRIKVCASKLAIWVNNISRSQELHSYLCSGHASAIPSNCLSSHAHHGSMSCPHPKQEMSSVQPHGHRKQLKSFISNPSLKITLIASVIEKKTKLTNTFSKKEN